MELIGKWKIKKVFCITPDGMAMVPPAELPKGEEYDEYRIISESIFDFRPGGIAYQLLSPELYAKLDREEKPQMLDGMVIMEQHAWKEENGEYFYDTGVEGEVLGEQIDPYAKLEPDEDGCLPMSAGLILIERI